MLRLYRAGLLDRPARWRNDRGARVRLSMLLRMENMETSADAERDRMLARVSAQSALMGLVSQKSATDFLSYVSERMSAIGRHRLGDPEAMSTQQKSAGGAEQGKMIWQALVNAGYCSN